MWTEIGHSVVESDGSVIGVQDDEHSGLSLMQFVVKALCVYGEGGVMELFS